MESGLPQNIAALKARMLLGPSKDSKRVDTLVGFQRLEHIVLPWYMLFQLCYSPSSFGTYLPVALG